MANEQRPQGDKMKDPSRPQTGRNDPGIDPNSPKGGQGGAGQGGRAGQPGKPGQTQGGNRPADWEDPMKKGTTGTRKDDLNRDNRG
ncbi:hypothetical protein [Pseudomonas sp. R5(2019)]|uniref:hypothetical protein n=1 Tax=Pseudomonas sp. R5(2019) TaxID=2697566 RepID=UPI001412B7B3|nr:hypothetical protein [Pseudomonas sp. R5(2019)]NBA97537.1 hypothetical protein [Pseudomonas sp. R5(2019)]